MPISSTPSTTLILARRDLFDARFQLISEGAGDAPSTPENCIEGTQGIDSNNQAQALAFLDAPSDLVPGVYEGGLKTWECSLDLVDCLEGIEGAADIRGKRALEVSPKLA